MRIVYHMLPRFTYLFPLLLLLSACQTVEPLPTLVAKAVLPNATVSLPTTLPAATAVSPLNPPGNRTHLSVQSNVPADLTTAAQKIAQQHLDQFTWVDPDAAEVMLAVGEGRPLARWLYVVAVPFATVEDGLTFVELQTRWQANTPAEMPILVTASTAEALIPVLGAPGTAVQVVAEADLVTAVWRQRPSLTILPFHKLTPELKVLQLDSASPLSPEFALSRYPLLVEVGVVGDDTAVTQFQTFWDGPVTNYNPDKLTRVAMTGVTALVRATAFNMEQYGVLWPGEEVGPVLQGADIAHISNEVAFAADCPYPDPLGGTTFCSSDAYFELIQNMGADVVELTGNHENDWGHDNFLRTIDMYEEAGLPYYGGGRNVSEAAQPALFEHNGNRIAFVGCNSFGPPYAWATETAPGAMPCNGHLPAQIAQLRADGYQVIVTLQYTEIYHYAPTGQQELDFKALLAAGATAVSGSQGHHVQGFAFDDGGFIHYGLGNLFFDQMDQLGTRQTFVDTYIFYDGRLLSVQLWTGLIEQYARPRLMTPEERAQVLTTLFQASNWDVP